MSSFVAVCMRQCARVCVCVCDCPLLDNGGILFVGRSSFSVFHILLFAFCVAVRRRVYTLCDGVVYALSDPSCG